MLRTFIIVLLLTTFSTFKASCIAGVSGSGNDESLVTSPIACVFLELSGSAASFGSINVEARVLRFDKHSLVHSLRVSAGIGVAEPGNGYLPLLAKGLLFDSNHHLEFGLGGNVLYRRVITAPGSPYKSFSDAPVNPILLLGYRYEERDGGFLFRACYTPMYDVGYEQWSYLIGVSIGYAF